MQEGVDVSWAQGNYQPGTESFVFANASRANTKAGLVVGDWYHRQIDNARKAGKDIGHYFFNGNMDPIQCANFFVKNLYDFRPGDWLWLDTENESSTGTIAWDVPKSIAFVRKVRDLTGVTAGMYMNASVMSLYDWSPLVNIGSPLWLAYYAPTLPVIKWWPAPLVWQYTSTPIDRDRAYIGC